MGQFKTQNFTFFAPRTVIFSEKNGRNPSKNGRNLSKTEETLSKTEEIQQRKEKKINKKEIYKEKAANAAMSGANAPDPIAPEPQKDFKSLIDFVNDEFSKHGSTIPKLRTIDGTRKTHIMARIREYGEDAFREVVQKAAVSDFLNGKNNKGWIATLDWMMLPNNFIKVLEGNYDNDRHNNQNGKFNAGLDPRFNFSAGNRGVDAEQYPDVL